MKERPIIFNGPMVRAILEGRKTQTRRALKLQNDVATKVAEYHTGEPSLGFAYYRKIGGVWHRSLPFACPFGKVGDRLWVKETFAIYGDEEKYVMHYKADRDSWPTKGCGWRPSIHMPRRASRITLEITNVRVERLQDISDEDAKAEGVYAFHSQSPGLEAKPYYRSLYSPTELFQMLWDSINGEGAWDCNEWVWVIEFKRVGGRS
jgi:hypothetical protein